MIQPATVEQRDPALAALQQQIVDLAAAPLKDARGLPGPAYTDPAFYTWECDHVFRSEWLCLAHVSQLPNNGDYVNVDLLGEPLIVIRGKDGIVRVLSRVCPHRGMDILPAEYGRPQRGHTRMLICPYHTWTFELDGAAKGCPEMQHAQGFCKEDVALAQMRSEVFEGFVFVNPSGDASPAAERFADMKAFVGKWNLGELKVVTEDSWDCPFSWKMALENFSESYHHMGTHARTLQPMMPARGTRAEPARSHFIRAYLPYRESLAKTQMQADPTDPLDGFNPVPGVPPEDLGGWHLFVAPPSFGLVVARDRAIWYRFLPTGPQTIDLLTTTLVTPDNLDRPDYEEVREREREMGRAFHLEDMEVLTAMQRGARSRYYQTGRLSHLEEPVWLLNRWLAARIAGTYPQDQELTGFETDKKGLGQ